MQGRYLPCIFVKNHVQFAALCVIIQCKLYQERGQSHMLPVLYIVIPCYNEEAVLPITAPQFLTKLQQLMEAQKVADTSRILFVDDGSRDGTWDIISRLAEENSHITGIRQSRNRGHQNALLAGLMEVKDACDITISIDCDGQDDLNAMDEMVDCYHDGCQIVYGVRRSRETDTFFKRTTAQGYYKLLDSFGVECVYNHADYRLVSRQALQALSEFEEVNLFLRGMFPLVGFKSTSVYYDRQERLAGRSHYPLSKMVNLAIDGITSLSIKPLRMITMLGFLVALVSFVGVLWSILQHFRGMTVAGWASMTCIICFVAGVQLVGIGVLGEYIGKIYLEVKRRPRYIISQRTTDRQDEE